MDCPFCHTPMHEGYLTIGGPALWTAQSHPLTLLPYPDETYALQLGQCWFGPHRIASFCCPQCKRIILDASPYPNKNL
ncbi:PF20097 family protein [Faecalibacterium sp. An122]|uniref:PF20097 family protein n=1 Tax=Faecalibacterium sp. An122 TaxID=1965551 RepID=UPI000B372977|nr:PF20097 family protein [Faecalibacterium sp. An122]OUQ39490.1 hypothetical protein B5E67_03005 [Faecalibacterium sp. An122]